MEDREFREYFRRAYKVLSVMQRKLQAEGVKDSEILRKMADIIEVIEDHPELAEEVLKQLAERYT